jgi:hypothetical protein
MTTSKPAGPYQRSRIRGLVKAIRRQNDAYDDLARSSPNARFVLFIAPPMVSVVADMILVFAWGLPSFLFIVMLMIMGAWRLIGTSVDVNRRT